LTSRRPRGAPGNRRGAEESKGAHRTERLERLEHHQVQRALQDIRFGGNSGGPIFINQLGRPYGHVYHIDETVFKILGLVSNQVTIAATGERLNVAGVVHAQFIKETIDALPAAPATLP